MRPAPALAGWLRDEAAQAASAEASARVARQGACERLAGFERELDVIGAAHDGPGASQPTAACVRRLFERTDWLVALLGGLGDHLRHDPFFEPPFAPISSPVHRGLLLVDHPLVTVAVLAISADAVAAKRHDAGPTTVSFGGLTVLTSVVQGSGAHALHYESRDPGENARPADALSCRFAGREELAPGAILEADGRTRTIVIDPGKSDVVILRAELRSATAILRRDHDAESGAIVGLGMVDEKPARTQLMLSLLRALGRVDAAPVFADVIAHAPFFLRWYAMREMLALDPDAAIPLLDRLANGDPHPEVRDAAARTRDDLARRYPALFAASHELARPKTRERAALPCRA